MQLNQIAKDLAKKAVVSRTLGGVIKAGEYAKWASDYKNIAEEHYASLEMEKEALSPLVANALLGGGIGALGGGLGGYFTSNKKKKLKDALTYGLLGGLGGAGLGAAGTLLTNPDAAKELAGDTTPTKINKIEEMRDAINARGLSAATAKGNILGLAGLGGGGYLAGTALDKKFKLEENLRNKHIPNLVERYNNSSLGKSLGKIKLRGETTYSTDDKPFAKFKETPQDVVVREAIPDKVVSPAVPEKTIPATEKIIKQTPEKIIPENVVSRKTPGGFTHEVIKTPKKVIPAFTHEVIPAKPSKIIPGKPEVVLPGRPAEIAKKLLGPHGENIKGTFSSTAYPGKRLISPKSRNLLGKGLGGLGVLASLASNIGGTADSTKAQIINENVSKLLRSPEVAKNPQLMGLLSNIQKETAQSWKNWVPGLGGISKQRANEILDTLANNFSN